MTKLSANSIENAKLHIEKHGDTDIFPVPFEYDAIFSNWENVKDQILSKNIDDWQCLPYRRCLTPKSENGFRISTQLDPIETLLLTALTFEVGEKIESYRRPYADGNTFSSRFDSSRPGEMFDSAVNWKAFDSETNRIANSSEFQYIVSTDIADFFPRIYHHPLENALTTVLGNGSHLKLFKKLLKHWTYSISSGIPVGQSSTRLLAELSIVDIDQALRNEGVTFLRFVDDIRIFAKTKQDALGILSRLATILYENHSLTLSKHKTKIQNIADYLQDRNSLEQSELNSLSNKIDAIVGDLNINLSPYDGEFSSLDLTSNQVYELSLINLKDMFLAELEKDEEIDSKMISYLLNRVRVFGDYDLFARCIDKIEFLYPSIRKIINFGIYLAKSTPALVPEITEWFCYLATRSFVSQIPYHRMMAFNAISQIGGIVNPQELLKYYRDSKDEFSKRELLLLFGQSNMFSWFKENRRGISSYEHWERRAFIRAARCLPGDEFSHWGRSFKENQSDLEKLLFL